MPGFLGGGGGGGGGTGGQISFPKEFIDPVTKFRVSQPENLIDTDFEYGLQPTKWETVELINNTPSFFSKSGDTTIDGIISMTTNAGTREITVTTALDHNLAAGIPINVTGTKSLTADGSFIIASIPNTTTFTYLCKSNQNETLSINDLYTSIITGEFFQGSQIGISDSEGILTDGTSTSILTVKTKSTHGFGIKTPLYLLNINSTISQDFQSANTATRSFDASNSATAQTFDGSNTLLTTNVDLSNSGVESSKPSTINSVSTTANTITVSHGTENFSGLKVGTPLYYDVVSGSGYFAQNPRGVVFLKTTDGLSTSFSTFKVSVLPDGDEILIEASISGTFQVSDLSRTFAGNNINVNTQNSLEVFEEAPTIFDGANNLGSISTVSIYSGTTIQMENNAGSSQDTGLYPGAMVQYSTTGSAASGLVNNETYFIRSISTIGGLAGLVNITIGALPDSTSAITVSGGTGTQTFKKIGVSVTKDIWHVPGNTYGLGDMVRYTYPSGGAISRTSSTTDYMYVEKVYSDTFNVTFKDNKGKIPTGLTQNDPGDSAVQLKADWGYNTNQVYFIKVNGVSEPVYCIMDSNIDGGGWMMIMKATRGTTFSWGSSYWTAINTLNPAQTNRNDGDAKFNIMNYFPAKDILALWPDIGQGGSLSRAGYPWIWLENNFNFGNRVVPIQYWASVDRQFKRDALTFTGWGSPWSTQTDVRFYGFNFRNNPGSARTRWGFGWNENGGGLYPNGNMDSDDVFGGIGMNFGSYSAGDGISCCQNRTGMNRTARVEVYVR
jgi:hypothetical protein